MLTAEQINTNREEFINLLRSTNIPGADIEGLLTWLDNTDFYYAPASTIYHNNFDGGLCAHSLNVYHNIVKLANDFYPNIYSNDTLIIVSLLHDLSKTNFYEKYTSNKKVYNEHGSKHDNMGNFDWFAEEAFKVKDASDRFIGGEHGENSVYLANNYIPFTFEELMSIRHHHFFAENGSGIKDISPIYDKYPLCTLLHMADFISTYISESKK